MRPKKHFGQNFLTSQPAIGKIVDAAFVQQGDTVVEIGPGKGALTQELLSRGARVIAIEADAELIPFLEEKFMDALANNTFVLVRGDALLVTDEQLYSLCGDTYKLVANIPYYITGALIEAYLSRKFQPSLAVLLVQREVAERIVRRDIHGGMSGAGSILSEAVAAYGTPKYIHTVKAGSFFPAPTVDSAILQIASISRERFNADETLEHTFFSVLKAGFAHKRKMLLSNLAEANIADRQKLVTAFATISLHEKIRAEELTTDQWITLAQQLQ